MSDSKTKADTLSSSSASVTTLAPSLTTLATTLGPIQIIGLLATQSAYQGALIRPFTGVTISDPNPPVPPNTVPIETVNVRFDNPLSNTAYTINGTQDGATAALRALSFSPLAPDNLSTVALPANANYTSTTGFERINLGGGSSIVRLQAGAALVVGDAGSDYIEDNAAHGQPIITNVTINVTDSAGATGSATSTIATANTLATTINLGTGNTTVNVLNGGPVVSGNSVSGSLFFSGGAEAAVVNAGAGATTVFANAGGGQFFGGQAASLLFVGGSGASTAVGSAGRNIMFGGSSGHDLLVAGTGASTVVGSGDGVVIVGLGSAGDVLVAGNGAETLVGSAGGGNDILFGGTGPTAMFAGTGNDTLVAATGGGPMFSNTTFGAGTVEYIFSNGAAGSNYTLWNFRVGPDHVALFGYGNNAVANALATATVAFSSTTITLPDNSRITFANVANLNSSAFF